MSEHSYINKFIDIDGKEQIVYSRNDLSRVEWLAMENEHNIKILDLRCVAYDFLVRESDAKEDTLNLREKS